LFLDRRLSSPPGAPGPIEQKSRQFNRGKTPDKLHIEDLLFPDRASFNPDRGDNYSSCCYRTGHLLPTAVVTFKSF